MTRRLPLGVALTLAACDGSPAVLPGPLDVVGTWGGENAGFIADDTSAHVHIACTFGNVSAGHRARPRRSV